MLQAANCANTEILVILLLFVADSHVGGKNFPAPVLLSILVVFPLCRGIVHSTSSGVGEGAWLCVLFFSLLSCPGWFLLLVFVSFLIDDC